MKRLILRILILFLLTTSLTGAVVAYVRTQSGENPLKAYGFDLCGDEPCFRRLVLGQVTWDGAAQILHDSGKFHYSDNPKAIEFSTDFGNGYLRGKIDFRNGQMLGQVESSNPETLSIDSLKDGFPGITDFILLYGVPCNVESWIVDSHLLTITMTWPHLKIMSRAPKSQSELELENSLEWLVIGSAPSNFCDEYPFQDLSRLPWKGFSSFARYYP